MKLGNDIIEIDRIRQAIESSSFKSTFIRFMRLNIVKVGIKDATNPLPVYMLQKRLLLKLWGTGMRHGSWQDIEIYHDEWGAPLIRLQDTFKDIYETSGYTDIHVSISHCRDYAMSTVIPEGA